MNLTLQTSKAGMVIGRNANRIRPIRSGNPRIGIGSVQDHENPKEYRTEAGRRSGLADSGPDSI
jgi:hypothetical protein